MTTDEDDLLQALGRHVRSTEYPAEATRLELLVYGELSALERKQLELAAEHDPQLSLALRAYSPISDERRTAISKVAVDAFHDRSRSRVLSWRRASLLVMPLAAAAAILLWVNGRNSTSDFPEYALEIQGGEKHTRARQVLPSDAPLEVSRTSRLDLVLRPIRSTTADVTAVVYVLEADGTEWQWENALQSAGSGAIRLKLVQVPKELEGTAEMRVIVATPRALESRRRELLHGAQDGGAEFQRFRIRLRVVPSH